MKQTAVVWLFVQGCSEQLNWKKDSNGKLLFDKITSDILDQAKAMEKEQMHSEYMRGWRDGLTKQIEK
jgi:hypothetical protein